MNWYCFRYLRNAEEKRTNVFALLYQILCDLVQDFLQKSSGLCELTPSTVEGRAADSQLQVQLMFEQLLEEKLLCLPSLSIEHIDSATRKEKISIRKVTVHEASNISFNFTPGTTTLFHQG